jgi:hypothetical protein
MVDDHVVLLQGDSEGDRHFRLVLGNTRNLAASFFRANLSAQHCANVAGLAGVSVRKLQPVG